MSGAGLFVPLLWNSRELDRTPGHESPAIVYGFSSETQDFGNKLSNTGLILFIKPILRSQEPT